MPGRAGVTYVRGGEFSAMLALYDACVNRNQLPSRDAPADDVNSTATTTSSGGGTQQQQQQAFIAITTDYRLYDKRTHAKLPTHGVKFKKNSYLFIYSRY